MTVQIAVKEVQHEWCLLLIIRGTAITDLNISCYKRNPSFNEQSMTNRD